MTTATTIDLKRLRFAVGIPLAAAALLGAYRLGGYVRERELLDQFIRQGMQDQITSLRGDLGRVLEKMNAAPAAKEDPNAQQPQRPAAPLRRAPPPGGRGCLDQSSAPAAPR